MDPLQHQNSQPAIAAIGVKLLKSTARSRPGTFCASICLTSFGPTHGRASVLAVAPGATVTPGPTSGSGTARHPCPAASPARTCSRHLARDPRGEEMVLQHADPAAGHVLSSVPSSTKSSNLRFSYLSVALNHAAP
jgi:hypothetical protein